MKKQWDTFTPEQLDECKIAPEKGKKKWEIQFISAWNDIMDSLKEGGSRKGYEKIKPKKEKDDGMEKTQRKSTANRREMCDP